MIKYLKDRRRILIVHRLQVIHDFNDKLNIFIKKLKYPSVRCTEVLHYIFYLYLHRNCNHRHQHASMSILS